MELLGTRNKKVGIWYIELRYVYDAEEKGKKKKGVRWEDKRREGRYINWRRPLELIGS